MKRILKLVGLGLGLIIVASTIIHIVRSHTGLPPRPSEFEIIAHAGVHQNYPTDNLTDETCTAARIYPLTHHFIDNTIPASLYQGGSWNGPGCAKRRRSHSASVGWARRLSE